MLDYDEVSLSDHMDFFMNFPNLEQLYVQKGDIHTIDFVKEMEHLRILDITDNYISDISALHELPSFEKLYCG